MKNYVVKALKYFKDKEEKVERKAGDNFETTKERYEFLKANNAVKLVEIQETIDDVIEGEITEEEVQAVASAIVEEAQEQDKSIEEVVKEIVEEQKQDELVEEIITKKKKSSKK